MSDGQSMAVAAAEPASRLTKLTVNLIPNAVGALDVAIGLSGDTKTETVNRGLQLYAFVLREMDQGHQVWIVDPATGRGKQVELL